MSWRIITNIKNRKNRKNRKTKETSPRLLIFRDSCKSTTCRNLIDMWRVLRHLQYNISDNIDKSLYDVRASEPYHGGTEQLMNIKIIEKNDAWERCGDEE